MSHVNKIKCPKCKTEQEPGNYEEIWYDGGESEQECAECGYEIYYTTSVTFEHHVPELDEEETQKGQDQ